MSRSWRYCPGIVGTLRRHLPALGAAALIGGAVVACSGSETETDEPIQAEAGDEGTGETAATAENPEAVAGEEAAVVEDSVAAESEPDPGTGLEGETASAGDPSAEGDTTAAPPEVMEAQSDTVNAELSQPADTPPPAVEPEEEQMLAETPPATGGSMPADTPAALPESAPSVDPAPVSMASASMPGVVSSPGAAMNLGNKPYSAAAMPATTQNTSDMGVYMVVPGDTLARISGRIFGSAGKWQSLASTNGIAAPYVIRPGDELRFPLNEGSAQKFADSYAKARKTVVVKKGDTLSGIAERLYGASNSWKVLYGLNKDQITNPNQINVGQKLAYIHVDGAVAGTSAKKSAKAYAKKPAAKPVEVVKPQAVEQQEDDGPAAPEAVEEPSLGDEEMMMESGD